MRGGGRIGERGHVGEWDRVRKMKGHTEVELSVLRVVQVDSTERGLGSRLEQADMSELCSTWTERFEAHRMHHTWCQLGFCTPRV